MKQFKKIIGIFICITIINSCQGNKENTTLKKEQSNEELKLELTEAQFKNTKITTGEMDLMPMSTVIKLNGIIDVPPQNMVSISMPLGGYLKHTSLLPGMHVKKGELIAVMEDQQYIQLQEDYLKTKIKLQFAEQEYLRQKELNVSKASSDKTYQLAESEYNSLKISFKSYTEKLKLININPNGLSENSISKNISIYSPINGYVAKVNVNIGKYLSPTDVMFELVNPEDIHLNLMLHEKDLNSIKIGQKLTAYNNSQLDKKYKCHIILISKNLKMDNTIEVHCHFEQYDKNLLPGMYMNAEIESDKIEKNTLPESSIVEFEGKSYVFEEYLPFKYQIVEVQKGVVQNGFIEIVNHQQLLKKKIVLTDAYTLLMMMKNIEEE